MPRLSPDPLYHRCESLGRNNARRPRPHRLRVFALALTLTLTFARAFPDFFTDGRAAVFRLGPPGLLLGDRAVPSITAWAAPRRAIGTRYGEQLT